jgi:hypothetical protein
VCPTCRSGQWCTEAWSHLDPPYQKRDPHRETEEERERAQEKYQKAHRRKEPSGRKKAEEAREEAKAQGREWSKKTREEWNRRSWEQQRKFWEDLFGDAFGKGHGSVFSEEDIRRAQDSSIPEERWDDPPLRTEQHRSMKSWCLKVLGLSSLPTRDELKKLWKELARQYHPDLAEGGDHYKMALINRAKDYLEDYLN